nr:MAG TPA: hypothetical protein [Caudoviricetes sp.]
MNKNINLGGVSNIVNSTKDLEWFMTQFIRKYEEMAELYDAEVVDNELEELKADGQIHGDCGCQDQKRPSPQPVGNRHHDVDDKHILPPK